jgi:ABC-type transport system involved in multi-copper enzyme maturation permease subunit
VKLPAILKDSLREAIDRKIFAVMLVLGALLTLFVASISYRPITLEEELQAKASQFSFIGGFPPHGETEFRIEDFHQTNAAAEPWRGDYQFDWVIAAKDMSKVPFGWPKTQWWVRRFITDNFHYLTNVEVSANKSKDANLARFTVTSHGTTVEDFLGWRYEPKILFAVPIPFWHTSVREMVFFVEDTLVNGFGAWAAVLIGVVITASFVPSMMQKGAMELWLSKPLRRPGLLVAKYLGGLTFVFLLTAATVLGVWTAIGMRSGIWSPGFLVVIPAVTFSFALLYSVSVLGAVLTRSTVVAILLTLAAWFGLWLNGTVHTVLDGFRQARVKMDQSARAAAGPVAAEADPETPPEMRHQHDAPDVPQWAYRTSDIIYKTLPRTRELDALTAEWVGRGLLTEADQKKLANADRPPWWETVGVTAAFLGVMLGLACWRFSRADY